MVLSGSGDVVGHGAIGPALSSSVNGINVTDTVSKSETMGATGAIGHNASGTMHPSGDSINGNDTATSDTVSGTGVEKDPVGINNSVSSNSDNNVRVTVVDSGFVSPSGVSDVTSVTENVVSNVGRDVGGEPVAAGGDPRP